MKTIAGPGSWLAPGDKLALLLIGDLVSDADSYWEAQGSLAERMGVSRRSAGRAVRKLEEHGALEFVGWRRGHGGATVKEYRFEPEFLAAEVGETFPAEVGETFPPETEPDEPQVGRNVQAGGKKPTPRWEALSHKQKRTIRQNQDRTQTSWRLRRRPPHQSTTHKHSRRWPMPARGICGRCWRAFNAGKHWQTLRVAFGLQPSQEPWRARALSGAVGMPPAAYTVRGGWR
jgi:hypothetical protein